MSEDGKLVVAAFMWVCFLVIAVCYSVYRADHE